MIAGEHFDVDNPQHQNLIKQLEAMEARAQKLDMNLNEIVKETLIKSDNKYSLLQEHINSKVDETLFNKADKIKDKFNFTAQSDTEFKAQQDSSLKNNHNHPSKTIGMNL